MNRRVDFSTASTTIPFVFGLNDLLSGANWTYPSSSYPPYNVLQDENLYFIEVAVAGFTKDDIKVEKDKNTLSIVGKREKPSEKETKTYLHRGVSSKDFDLRFKLADTVVIDSVNLKDGILKISLQKIVPEESKPKVYEIT